MIDEQKHLCFYLLKILETSSPIWPHTQIWEGKDNLPHSSFFGQPPWPWHRGQEERFYHGVWKTPVIFASVPTLLSDELSCAPLVYLSLISVIPTGAYLFIDGVLTMILSAGKQRKGRHPTKLLKTFLFLNHKGV